MMMPEWSPSQRDLDHHPISEGHRRVDRERELFEREAVNPYRNMDRDRRRRQNSWYGFSDDEYDDYHRQYRYLNTEPVLRKENQGQEADDMARKAIDSFSKIMTPDPHSHDELQGADPTHHPQVLKAPLPGQLLETVEDSNRIKAPKFHWT